MHAPGTVFNWHLALGSIQICKVKRTVGRARLLQLSAFEVSCLCAGMLLLRAARRVQLANWLRMAAPVAHAAHVTRGQLDANCTGPGECAADCVQSVTGGSALLGSTRFDWEHQSDRLFGSFEPEASGQECLPKTAL